MLEFGSNDARLRPLQDARLKFWVRPNLPRSPNSLFDVLLSETPWKEEDIVLFGKRNKQPRLIAWYGDADARYTYSGVMHEPLPWTSALRSVKHCVEQLSGHRYNSALLNLYRNHRDSMGMHSDDEPELGEAPVIASLSLGEERTLRFAHRTDKSVPAFKLPLPGGSLLVMSGQTQRYWKHGVAKLSKPCGPRINLTFRKILGG